MRSCVGLAWRGIDLVCERGCANLIDVVPGIFDARGCETETGVSCACVWKKGTWICCGCCAWHVATGVESVRSAAWQDWPCASGSDEQLELMSQMLQAVPLHHLQHR